MTRDDRRSHGANPPADSEKPKAVNCARAAGAPAPPARAAWLKPLADYERRQRREYQVNRFG